MVRFNIVSSGYNALRHYGWAELLSNKGTKMIEVVLLCKGGDVIAGRNKMLFADLLKTINKYYALDAVPYDTATKSPFRLIRRIRRTKDKAEVR